MSNDEKLKERFPSMRDVWPPNTVGVKRSPPSSSNDEHGEHVSVTESFDEPVQPVPPVGRVAAIICARSPQGHSEQALDLARVHARECRATVLACRGKFLEGAGRLEPDDVRPVATGRPSAVRQSKSGR